MKRALVWTLAAAAALLVILIAAVWVASRVIDPNDYKPQLEKLVAEQTGRSLRVSGDVRLSLFPWIGLSFAGLSLGNPAGFPDPAFLRVKAFEVRLKVWPLLFRQVEVGRLVIEEPELALVTLTDGRVNWEFGGKGTAPAAPAKATPSETALPLRSLTAEEIRIRNGTIRLIDQRAGTEQTIRRLDLSILDVAVDQPLRLALSAEWEGKPVALEGRLGPLGDFSRPAALPLELRLSALGRLNASVRGKIDEPLKAPRAAVSLEIPEFSARGLLSELKLAPPATRDPRVLEKVGLKAELQADASSAALSGGQLVLDDTKVSFEARFSEFARPRIEARLNIDAIDLDRYLPPKAPAPRGG
ncbi:MAG: AsmA family protein, partial [Desulfobacterales bacterium]